MTYQSDAERLTRVDDPPIADPRVDPALRRGDPYADPALRDVPPTARRPASMLWIVAGLVILLGIFALWGGMIDRADNTVVDTVPPPATQEPAIPPAPAPAPAQ